MDTMLTPKEVTQYQEQGFYIPKFRLSPTEVATLQSNVDQLVRGHSVLDNDVINEAHKLDVDESGYNPALMDICTRREILDMVESIDGPDLIFWTSSIFHKQAGVGVATPWHQDHVYWPIEPMTGTTVWIAATQSTQANGCLRLFPGSHKQTARHESAPGTRFFQKLAPDAFDEADAVDIEIDAGQMVLFDSKLIHGSRPNTAGRERSSFTIRYMPSMNRFEHDRGSDHNQPRDPARSSPYTNMTLYLVRGVNRCPRNDLKRNHPPQKDAALTSADH